MQGFRAGPMFAALAALAVTAGLAHGQTSFNLPPIGGAVMTADNKTLIVSVPSLGALVYFDTLADKEAKRVEVDFQPNVLALQGDKLFASTKGASAVHILNAATAKEIKSVRLPGEPVQGLACHPGKGLVYATNTANDVLAIDPEAGTAARTKAKGQLIVVDPVAGKFVYTGIQGPIREQLIIRPGPGKSVVLSLARVGQRAVMLKYAVDGKDLKLVAANDNAAINGRGMMGISPDGKRIALPGGGGWRSKTDPRANYAIAVFDTETLKDMQGQVQTGAYPVSIAFHPVLKLGAAYHDGNAGVVMFNARSFATKDSYKVEQGGYPAYLGFGGQGTKVIYAPLPRFARPGQAGSVLQFFPLALTDQDRDALRKAYGK